MEIGMIIRALNDKLRREILDILKAGLTVGRRDIKAFSRF